MWRWKELLVDNHWFRLLSVYLAHQSEFCTSTELPFQNAFSKRLANLGFNFYEMLVVDLMHEFELGVWKSLFIHLVRLLQTIDSSKIHEMDRRYVLLAYRTSIETNAFSGTDKSLLSAVV